MKRTAVDHQKTRYFESLIKRPRFHVLGILESIWQLTAKDFPRGDIGRISNERISGCIGWDGSANELINALEMAGFLDPHPIHRLVVHDWPHHCEDSTHCYLARKFERFAGGAVPKFTRLNTLEKKGIVEKWERILAGEKVATQTQGELFTENKCALNADTSREVQTLPSAVAFASAIANNSHSQEISEYKEPGKTNEREGISPKAEKKPENFVFPAVLDTDEFHEAWRMFKAHCCEKGKPHTRIQAEMQLIEFGKIGPASAISSLVATMKAGLCTPIDPPKQKQIRKPDNVPREKVITLTDEQRKEQQAEIAKHVEKAKHSRPSWL